MWHGQTKRNFDGGTISRSASRAQADKVSALQILQNPATPTGGMGSRHVGYTKVSGFDKVDDLHHLATLAPMAPGITKSHAFLGKPFATTHLHRRKRIT